MKVAVSYSGGKESALSLYYAIKAGHEPIALITTYNTGAGRSHFHGLNEEVLNAVSRSVNVPIWLVKTTSQDYLKNFEAALMRAKNAGVQACVFGDIDIQGHFDWCTARCEAVGIKAIFPLWGKVRKDVVHELIESGFVANLTVVNTDYLDESFLGKRLTKELAQAIEATGADICGENGEYHTFVSDCSIFAHPVKFELGEILHKDNYAMMEVTQNGK